MADTFTVTKKCYPILASLSKTDMKIVAAFMNTLRHGQFELNVTYRELQDKLRLSKGSLVDSMRRLSAANVITTFGHGRMLVNPAMVYVGTPNAAEFNKTQYDKIRVLKDVYKMGRKYKKDTPSEFVDFNPIPGTEMEPVEEEDWILGPGEPREYDGP